MALQTVVATMQQGVLMSLFPPLGVNRQLRSLTVVGPLSSLDVWIGVYGDAGSHIDTTPNGNQNSTEYLYPKTIIAGNILMVTWATGTSTSLAYATADIIIINS